ncbi:MAG: STAS/SEC14 domain-containing protein [Verrucomicrobia bacterium]|nr:MAG: STAS/SEC14 domain-containing protein [Verrucomicrobiota bacterium]
MITCGLYEEKRLLHVHPITPLKKSDFEEMARTVDPFIEKTGKLNGLVIEAWDFPGWESLGAMIEHFRFIRNHHARIERVALVTDSRLGDVAERIGSHFVSAEIRHFPAGQLDVAEQWATDSFREGS